MKILKKIQKTRLARTISAKRNTRTLSQDTALHDIGFPFSKGWALHASSNGGLDNVFEPTEKRISKTEFARRYHTDQESYWLKMGSGRFENLDFFVETILPSQTVPFTLFSSDGDLTVPLDANPASVSAVLDHHLLVRWYSQNAVPTEQYSEKFRAIPIGLDLHSPRPDGVGSVLFEKLANIAAAAPPRNQRSEKIFVDLHLRYSSDLRRMIHERLADNPFFEFLPGRVTQLELWEQYAKHRFVLSTVGNGLDCHRTWEAIGLGCEVVTLSSPIDNLFKDLPIHVFQDIEELGNAQNLRNLIAQSPPESIDVSTISFKDFVI